MGEFRSAANAFRDALAAFRGPPMAGLDGYRFVDDLRREIEEERLAAAELLMEAEIKQGNHRIVLGELAALADLNPLRERLSFLLMTALHRAGRQADALRAYNRLKTTLAEELGVDPSKELRDLEERVLLQDPALSELNGGGSASSWLSRTHVITYRSGQRLIEQGMHIPEVAWIEDGWVEALSASSGGKPSIVDRMGPGQYFGELQALLGTEMRYTIQAATDVLLTWHSVEEFRRRLASLPNASGTHAGASVESIEDMIRRGEYSQAFDAASTAMGYGATDTLLRYLAVLALARAGATARARQLFEAYGLDSSQSVGSDTPLSEDIAALDARLDKDTALSAEGHLRELWALRSARKYEAAFDRIGTPYLGVNAATMLLLAGRIDEARIKGQTVLNTLDAAAAGARSAYWPKATEAEAALIVGDTARASHALHAAGLLSGDNPAARATTLRQLRVVCEQVDAPASILEPIVNRPVLHYCGHRIGSPSEATRLRRADEGRVQSDVQAALATIAPAIGVGSLAAGADIITAECLIALGAELSVVLPVEVQTFVDCSVAPAGENWVRRFEFCLDRARSVSIATPGVIVGDPALFDFGAQVAMGEAIMRADLLETTSRQLAVWDGVETGAIAGTAVDVRRWRDIGGVTTVIPVEGDEPPVLDSDSSRHEIRAVVVGRFNSAELLGDAEAVALLREVIGPLGGLIDGLEGAPRLAQFSGTTIELVFDSVGSAASCALAIQEAMSEYDFERMDLPRLEGLGLAADVGPSIQVVDPLSGMDLLIGTAVDRARRLAEGTPTGEIYVTAAFAALAALDRNARLESRYVGSHHILPHGPGSTYALRKSTPR
jgi:CRP-like cAMP-binding protein